VPDSWNTTLINGYDLKSYGKLAADPYASAHAFAGLRGQPLAYGGMDGAVYSRRSLGTKLVTYVLALVGETLTKQNDAYAALCGILHLTSSNEIKRRVSRTAGDVTQVATGWVNRLVPSYEGPYVTSVLLEMGIFDGGFYADAASVISTGSVVVAGDLRTSKMVITLTGGTNPTLTNAQGQKLAFAGTPSSYGNVIIRPERIFYGQPIATNGAGSVDVSHLLTWTHEDVFSLEPGSQSLVLTGGGSASVSYQPRFA